ncbi:acetylcholinesterase-1-like [Amblyomma americanum]
MAAAPVPGSTADQQQRTTTGVNHGHIAEEGGTSVVEGSKSRRGKKRKGRRPGADRERKDHKEHRRDIGAPMEGHEEELSAPMTPASPKASAERPTSATTVAAPHQSEPRRDASGAQAKDEHKDSPAPASTSEARGVKSLSPETRKRAENRGGRQQTVQEKEGTGEREIQRQKEQSTEKQHAEGLADSGAVAARSPPQEEAESPKPQATAVKEGDASADASPKSLTSESGKPPDSEAAPSTSMKESTGTVEASKRPHPTPVARSVVISAAVLSLCCAGVAIIVWFQVDYVEVRVKTGSAVRGYRAFIRNRWVYTFLGIEYAQPPVHILRFRQPLPVVENSSVITATSKGPPCPQRDWFAAKVGTDGGWQGAEDCLHLNLWTPCIPNAEKADKCGKPVLIFLFAEGFQTGSNTRFDGSLLAATGDVVVVAPNFRLGVLGFFHRDGLEMPGNLPLHDQQVALNWVQRNVERFGGDWHNTVLMGAATGAWALGAHLLAYSPYWRSRPLRMLLHSESPFRRVFSASPYAFSEAVGCRQNKSSAKCLTEVPLETLLEAGRSFAFGPNYESRELPQPPWQMARRFQNNDNKEVLLGTVFNEGSPLFEILAQEGDESDSYMRIALRELLTTYGVDNPAKLVDLYAQGSWGSPRGSNMSWAHQLLGDVLFECPVLSFADYLSSRKNRVYVYRFDHKPSFSKFPKQPGASRLEDIDFIFGTPIQQDRGNPWEKALSRRTMEIVSSFIKSG